MKVEKNRLFDMYRYKNYNKRINSLVLLIIFCFVLEVSTTPIFTKQILDIEMPSKNIRRSSAIWRFIYYYQYNILLFCIKILYYKAEFEISNSWRIKERCFL